MKNTIMKLILLLLVLSVIIAFINMFVYDHTFRVSLLFWLIFVAVLAGLLFYRHYKWVKEIVQNPKDSDFEVPVSRSVKLELPYEKAFEVCKKSLEKIDNIKISQDDKSKWEIVAYTNITWSSFGNTITFKLNQSEMKSTDITITCQPSFFLQVIDYWESLKHLLAIESLLLEQNKN